MKKLEKEIKVLDIEVEQLKEKLESLGAIKKNDGIQKIYVYDLPSIYSRFCDCTIQLNQCSRPYDIEICKNKLRTLFIEIDNLATQKQQEKMLNAIGYKQLSDILLIPDTNKWRKILSASDLIKFVKQFGINPNKWVRLRETNGKTTITIKHILNQELQAKYGTSMQPVLETEMEVSDIESGNAILEQLGFSFRNYQEKKRTTYIFNDVEMDIDCWPLIPPYLEIEGETDEQIDKIVKQLGLSNKKIISCNTAEVYKEYGIDIYEFRELKFKDNDTSVKL